MLTSTRPCTSELRAPSTCEKLVRNSLLGRDLGLLLLSPDHNNNSRTRVTTDSKDRHMAATRDPSAVNLAPKSPFEGGPAPEAEELAVEEKASLKTGMSLLSNSNPNTVSTQVQNSVKYVSAANVPLLQPIGQMPFHSPVQGPVGGRLAAHMANWEKITNDPWILSVVEGYHVEWLETPVQTKEPHVPRFTQTETAHLQGEIVKMLQKRAIEQVHMGETKNQFISHLFLRPKKDGSLRPILNLKPLNRFVPYEHFKMEGLHMALDMIQPQEYFAKLDLKDAYYSMLIGEQTRPYLRFRWQDQLFQFRVCPFGLATAPRVFTKILKPVVSVLRRAGVKLVIYLDDMILLNQDQSLLRSQIKTTVWLLEHLGFQINWEKSMLNPVQQIEFLGFVIDSVSMKVSLPDDKVQKIQTKCQEMLNAKTVTVRALAKLIGKVAASVQAILPGPLHYRQLQILKAYGLKQGNQSYETEVTLSAECKAEIRWWMAKIAQWNGRSFIKPCPDLVLKIESDASGTGWGAQCQGVTAQGRWSDTEKTMHINALEMKAALFAQKARPISMFICDWTIQQQ